MILVVLVGFPIGRLFGLSAFLAALSFAAAASAVQTAYLAGRIVHSDFRKPLTGAGVVLGLILITAGYWILIVPVASRAIAPLWRAIGLAGMPS